MQPLLQWKSNKYYTFWVCIFSLKNPACNVHAPYYIVIRVWISNIFSYSYKQHDFFWGGGIVEHKMSILIFSTTFV